MTILELLRISTGHLKSRGFTNPKTSCEILLAHTLGVKRLDLYLNYDRQVSDEERERFRALYKRRLAHEPLQYITGETEFMSLPFMVNAQVLIPRTETEFVVENTIRQAEERWRDSPVRIVDVGAGCGNIAVSLAHYLPNAEVSGFDVSPEAVKVAQKNAALNNLGQRVALTVRDVFQLSPGDYADCHIVISNPPYVAEKDRHALDRGVIDFEPHAALFAGGDGLKFFRAIAPLASAWLVPGGLLVFEVGYDIGGAVVDIVAEAGFSDARLLKDYARLDRLVIAEKPG